MAVVALVAILTESPAYIVWSDNVISPLSSLSLEQLVAITIIVNMASVNMNRFFFIKPLNLKKLDDALLKYIKSLNMPKSLGFGCSLDPNSRSLLYADTAIPLRKREFVFLELLCESKGGLVSYEQIEDELWPTKSMTMVALKSFIKELRMKLPVNFIKNIRDSKRK